MNTLALQSNQIECVPAHIYLEKITENINAVLWLHSLKTNKIEYVSDNFEQFYGISRESYLKNPEIFYDIIHPDDRQKLYSQVFDEDHPNKGILEFRFRHKNGHWRHARSHWFMIKNQDGDTDTLAGLTIDDTDYHQAQLKIENQKQILAEKNEELYLMNKNMEEFNFMAFHDLSMPLRVINTHIQILEDKFMKVKDSESISLMHSIYTSIYRMKSLIDSIVNVPKFMNQGIRKKEMTCLRELLYKKIMPLFITALNPGLQINLLRMSYVHVDEDHLITLFKNIIENGIKYNSSKEKKIQVNVRRFKTGAFISISDNGFGIPKAQQDNIFAFGKRGADAPSMAHGLGIGLAACKRIVELYDGKIWLKSKPGEGSKFYIYFPDPQ